MSDLADQIGSNLVEDLRNHVDSVSMRLHVSLNEPGGFQILLCRLCFLECSGSHTHLTFLGATEGGLHF